MAPAPENLGNEPCRGALFGRIDTILRRDGPAPVHFLECTGQIARQQLGNLEAQAEVDCLTQLLYSGATLTAPATGAVSEVLLEAGAAAGAAFALVLTGAVFRAVNMQKMWVNCAACFIAPSAGDELALLDALSPDVEWAAHTQDAASLSV